MVCNQGRGSPSGATKKTHGAVRKRCKAISLGILYGLTIYGAAMRLGISLDEARAIIEQHLSLFSTYWEWSRRWCRSEHEPGEDQHRLPLNTARLPPTAISGPG